MFEVTNIFFKWWNIDKEMILVQRNEKLQVYCIPLSANVIIPVDVVIYQRVLCLTKAYP